MLASALCVDHRSGCHVLAVACCPAEVSPQVVPPAPVARLHIWHPTVAMASEHWEPIDLMDETAKWLMSHGVLAEAELSPGKISGYMQLNDAAATRLRNAKARPHAPRPPRPTCALIPARPQMVAALLENLYARENATCPIVGLGDGASVEARHHNWVAVMPTLKAAYAVDVQSDPDKKAMVVGGSARPRQPNARAQAPAALHAAAIGASCGGTERTQCRLGAQPVRGRPVRVQARL